MHLSRALATLGVLAPLVGLASAVACSSEPDVPGITDPAPPLEAGVQLADAGLPDVADEQDASDGAVVALAPFHVVGRFDGRDPAGPKLAWPGTAVRARFTGTGLTLKLLDTGASHYDVAIDGAPPTVLALSALNDTYEVAKDLPMGTHDVALVKRTEAYWGVTQLVAIAPTGGALVPSPAPGGRRIELIGDSMTCGYGVLGVTTPIQDCPFSADTESEPLAWGGLAAKELDALHTAIAFSGLGVYRNEDQTTAGTLPQRYARALPDDPASAWDPEGFSADVVVVALGTNDFAFSYGLNRDPGQPFVDAYGAFLATLRATHPAALVVAATSPLLDGIERTQLRAYIQEAIDARVAAGDAKLVLLDLDEQLASDGYACNYHPSKITQQKMATKLVALLRTRLGW